MAGMAPAPTPQDIAKAAGFPAPVQPATPAMPAPPTPLQDLNISMKNNPPLQGVIRAPGGRTFGDMNVGMRGPSAGTTEIVPGALDWIRQLVLDSMPSPQAAAAPVAAPLPGTLGLVNGKFSSAAKPISTTPPLVDRMFDLFIGDPSRQKPTAKGGVSG